VTPKEQCPLLERHEPHEWYKGNTFRRECKGRKHAAKEADRG
jgi:hypothetical protein